MRNKSHLIVVIVLFALLVLHGTRSVGSADDTLKIIQPAGMATVIGSNVSVAVQFNFDYQADPKNFQAWLNGRPVASLFEFTDTFVAKAQLSAKNGLNVSKNGVRMNLLAAIVEGPDGIIHQDTIQFKVDCLGNRAPVARIAPVEHYYVNELVQLDGSGSSDADGDPLAYKWSFVSVPKNSKAKFSYPSSAKPSFVPDMPGTYVAKLIVDDYKAKSPPKTVKVKTERLRVLIDRPVADAIFKKFSHNGVVHQYDGSQPLDDYHIAVFDGDAHTAQELGGNQLLREALAKGKWSLVLNVSESQKTDGLVPHLGIVNKDRARAYLFRRFLDGNTPVFRIIELPSAESLDPETDPETVFRYAGILLRMLKEFREDSKRSGVQATPPDQDIPADLINCRWDYSYTLPWSVNYSSRHDADEGRVQHGSYIVNYTFTLFLDNGNNPTGNKQFLLLQIDGEGNPNDYGSTFISTKDNMDKHNEYAWFQDKFTVDINPSPLTSPRFWSWVNNDPTSPNHNTTYTSNASFMMGFNQAQGGLGSFTYSSGKSYTLSDWGIGCNSSGNYMYWESISTNPPEHDGGYDPNDDMYDWFYGCGKPKWPNSMSMGQTQYHTSVVWRTDAVVNEVATFKSHLREHIAQNSCTKDLGTTCCNVQTHVHSHVLDFMKDLTWSLDLGAVIPIEIEAITFTPDPVLVGPLGGTIKGNVVLKSPAKIDTQIMNLSSNSPHATPKTDRIVISKGQTTASFDIDVNAQGINPGDYFYASISAFYAKGYTQQMRMQAVP